MEATISAGQSFGGALEAVTTHSALLGARHVARADVVIAVQGPGNRGTGTGWGFSGLQAAEALHAAAEIGRAWCRARGEGKGGDRTRNKSERERGRRER